MYEDQLVGRSLGVHPSAFIYHVIIIVPETYLSVDLDMEMAQCSNRKKSEERTTLSKLVELKCESVINCENRGTDYDILRSLMKAPKEESV